MKLSTQCVTYKTDTLKKISPEQQLLQQSEQQAAKLDLNWRSNFWLLGNPCNPFDHYWQVSSNFYGHNVESENRQAEKKTSFFFFNNTVHWNKTTLDFNGKLQRYVTCFHLQKEILMSVMEISITSVTHFWVTTHPLRITASKTLQCKKKDSTC